MSLVILLPIPLMSNTVGICIANKRNSTVAVQRYLQDEPNSQVLLPVRDSTVVCCLRANPSGNKLLLHLVDLSVNSAAKKQQLARVLLVDASVLKLRRILEYSGRSDCPRWDSDVSWFHFYSEKAFQGSRYSVSPGGHLGKSHVRLQDLPLPPSNADFALEILAKARIGRGPTGGAARDFSRESVTSRDGLNIINKSSTLIVVAGIMDYMESNGAVMLYLLNKDSNWKPNPIGVFAHINYLNLRDDTLMVLTNETYSSRKTKLVNVYDISASRWRISIVADAAALVKKLNEN